MQGLGFRFLPALSPPTLSLPLAHSVSPLSLCVCVSVCLPSFLLGLGARPEPPTLVLRPGPSELPVLQGPPQPVRPSACAPPRPRPVSSCVAEASRPFPH